MAECFYCGVDEKLTRAHLFQKPIRDALANVSDEMVSVQSSLGVDGLEMDKIQRRDIRNRHIRILCGGCNNGWMEQVEQAAEPVLKAIMRERSIPPVSDLFRLAHWAVIVNALATQTVGRWDVPIDHRRAIRYSVTGQPDGFGTHFVWTSDNYPSVAFDFMRSVGEGGLADEDRPVTWYCALHAGPIVMITAELTLHTVIERKFRSSNFENYVETLNSNLLYLPDAVQEGAGEPGGLVELGHHEIRELYQKAAAPGAEYVTSNSGRKMVSIDELRWTTAEHGDFEHIRTLVDKRAELDLSYLNRVSFSI